MPIEEDMHGTYILNSKDLRAIEHVQRLTEMGIDSFKIEGRTKSPYYVARTAQAYRSAIDDAVAGRPFNPVLLGHLEGLANRGYTDGFYKRHHDKDYQNYLRGFSISGRSLYVGNVVEVDETKGLSKIEVKNRFAVGDKLEIILPNGNTDFVIEEIFNNKGEPMRVVPGAGYTVWAKLPDNCNGAFLARYAEQENASKLEQIQIVEA
jgi:putative protease